ncbi:hypothetical protein TWF481_006169 [Arthrobotrys musiformis]|uniref:F-box domain-containing protein n=1 Tax=Arthrobotrys musiformis TaxID=47236 RepID=A0AAV9WFZ2_9PEZI
MPIDKIPLEVQLEIASNLDDTADFIALGQTCRELRSIRLYKSVRNRFFENETRKKLTPELTGLWNSLRYKSHLFSKRENPNTDAAKKAFKPQTKEEMLGSISEIAKVRSIIRWFTLKFIKHEWRHRKEEPSPTATEIERIDNAFCALWFWMETPFEVMRIDPYNFETATSIFSEPVHLKCSTSDAGVRLGVYNFLRGRIARIKEFRLSFHTKEDLNSIATISPCTTRYFKIGVPNTAMITLGLQGLKKLLTGKRESDLLRLIPCVMHPIHRRGYPHDEHQLLHCFTSLIGHYKENSTEELSQRAFWTDPSSICINGEASWVQPGIDMNAMFWDDERAKRWGYHPAKEHLTKEEIQKREDLALLKEGQNEVKTQTCTDCEPEWECCYQL